MIQCEASSCLVPSQIKKNHHPTFPSHAPTCPSGRIHYTYNKQVQKNILLAAPAAKSNTRELLLGAIGSSVNHLENLRVCLDGEPNGMEPLRLSFGLLTCERDQPCERIFV